MPVEATAVDGDGWWQQQVAVDDGAADGGGWWQRLREGGEREWG